MPSMEAFLDDFGHVQVNISRNFFNGHTGGFYLTGEDGMYSDCIVRGIEEHEREVRYDLTIPADYRFGLLYTLHESHGLSVPLKVRHIVRKPEFDRQFTYTGDDLGARYHSTYTDFALWAPTAGHVYLRLLDRRKRTVLYAMVRGDKGVFRIRVQGDLRSYLYVYLVERDGITVETTDPYGLSSDANSRHSAVIDTTVIESIPCKDVFPVMDSSVDAVIYECSVRDMTSSADTGTSTNGTFLALAEHGTTFRDHPTGLDYLASLGVTHVQLQPVMDFMTVDEKHPARNYNWGYDPSQFFALEGSFASDPENPYSRMVEFRKLVSAFHDAGLRVTLDVVFNHMYDVARSAFDKVLPYYYFRYNDNGWLSNGSYCGNDLDSLRPMMRKLYLDVIRTYMNLYHVDGFRFDLMGILDVDTMNEIYRTARSIKPDVLIYGEGWDMPTAIPSDIKARIYNQHRMPGIGHFNDTFRDIIKGRTSDDSKYDRGYLTGNLGSAFDMCGALTGNTMKEPYFLRFNNPIQSINALETHDNLTVWDKMHACCGDESREVRLKRQKMMIAATLVAQGIPFFHAGMEFCGTKNDNSNSYNAGDSINQMNWERMIFNYDMVEYTRRMIALRKAYRAFHIDSGVTIQKAVHFSIGEGSTLTYDIDCVDSRSHSRAVRVIFNPTKEERYFRFDQDYRIIADENGFPQEGKHYEFHVNPLTCIVLSREMEAD